MTGVMFDTDMETSSIFDVFYEVASQHGFRVKDVGEYQLSIRKGNLALSILLGAFFPYFDFTVVVDEGVPACVTLSRGGAWWTGIIGVRRVEEWARTLVNRAMERIQGLGFRADDPREF